MRWIWLAGAALFGVAALAVFFAAQNPAFWWGFAVAAAGALWKAIGPALAKRMSPEEEAQWHDAIRRGDDAEFRRRRSGAPPKG